MRRVRVCAGVVLAAALLFATAGCGGGGEDEGHVTRKEMGKQWPLTVDEGTLACDGENGVGAVTFTTEDGKEYAVNGTAKSQGYDAIEPIWAKGEGAIPKKDLTPLVDRGLKLCK